MDSAGACMRFRLWHALFCNGLWQAGVMMIHARPEAVIVSALAMGAIVSLANGAGRRDSDDVHQSGERGELADQNRLQPQYRRLQSGADRRGHDHMARRKRRRQLHARSQIGRFDDHRCFEHRRRFLLSSLQASELRLRASNRSLHCHCAAISADLLRGYRSGHG